MSREDWLTAALVGFVLLGASECSRAWDNVDKGLATTAVLVTLVDYGQTRTIAKNPDKWHEENNLLPEHPSLGDVNRHFLGVLMVGGLIAHFLPSAARKGFLGGVIIYELDTVTNNHKLGIKVSF